MHHHIPTTTRKRELRILGIKLFDDDLPLPIRIHDKTCERHECHALVYSFLILSIARTIESR